MPDTIIDLRSDTVTLPCEEMKKAMFNAQLGDDVYEADPTVIKLQDISATITGHEKALFFPSGTQSNLAALLSHCERGDEYIVAQNAHTYKYEGGGAAVLGSIQPQPLERNDNGLIDLERIEKAIKTDDFHFARTRLLALENTTTEGQVIPLDYITQARQLCDKHNLRFHLDGARVFNAAVASKLEVSEITRSFDSVSICLSKGLGAPVGSVLCGSEVLINKANRWRKMVGGGMRQSGLLAAAGIYALQNNIERLQQDHDLADYLANKLKKLPGVEIIGGKARTNMVFFHLADNNYQGFSNFAKEQGVLFGRRNPIRMVVHKDICTEQIDIAVERISEYFN